MNNCKGPRVWTFQVNQTFCERDKINGFFYKFKVPNAVMYKTLPKENDSLTCINQCHSGSVFERANKSNVHKIIHKSNIALTISA